MSLCGKRKETIVLNFKIGSPKNSILTTQVLKNITF
ncbi:MAG: hypothetical protein RIT22_1117 [Bacteroidota bacterium]|jgi:hypothetical protein